MSKSLYTLTVKTPGMKEPLILSFTDPFTRNEVQTLVEDRYGRPAIIDRSPAYELFTDVERALEAITFWDN
jgi:hypothetical protein